jgi:hypothetical protein
MAIRFRFHDWLNHRLISFQSATPRTTQNDEHFCAYRRSVNLHPIISASPIDARGLLPNARTVNVPTRFSVQKVRGSRSTSLSTSNTFYTHSATYKKQGASNWHPSLVHTLLILFTCATPHKKSKGLPIRTSSYFSYTFIINI